MVASEITWAYSMADGLNSFHVTQIILVVIAGFFWLQIYIRGFLFRSFKFEYGAYGIIIFCGAYGYITHLMWVEDQPVLTLAGFFGSVMHITRRGNGYLGGRRGKQWKQTLGHRALIKWLLTTQSILREKG